MSFWEHFTLVFPPRPVDTPDVPSAKSKLPLFCGQLFCMLLSEGTKVNSDKQSALRKSAQDL